MGSSFISALIDKENNGQALTSNSHTADTTNAANSGSGFLQGLINQEKAKGINATAEIPVKKTLPLPTTLNTKPNIPTSPSAINAAKLDKIDQRDTKKLNLPGATLTPKAQLTPTALQKGDALTTAKLEADKRNTQTEAEKTARWEYLAGKDALTDAEKIEAKEAVKALRKNQQNFSIDVNTRVNQKALADNLESKYSAGMAFGAGVAETIPGVKKTEEAIRQTNQKANPQSNLYSKTLSQNTQEAHPIAYTAGNMTGNIAQLMAGSEAVSAGLKGIPALQKAAPLVQKGVQALGTGAVFGTQNALTTASEGGTAKQTAQAFGRGMLGGTAGGVAGDVVGGGVSTLLSKAGASKILNMAITAAASGSAFSLADTGTTYFTYPKDYRPTVAQTTKDAIVNAAFGVVASLLGAPFAKKMGAEYEASISETATAEERAIAEGNLLKYADEVKAKSNNDLDAAQAVDAVKIVIEDNAAERTETGIPISETAQAKTQALTAESNPTITEKSQYIYDYKPEVQDINNKTWYHGSGTANMTAEKLSPSATKIEGLLGSGIYLTDNPDVAEGYAKGRGKRTNTPTVYEANVNVDSVIDMSKPMPNDVYQAFKKNLGYYADEYGYELDLAKIDAAQASGKNGVDVYKMYSEMLSDISKSEMVPLSEFYDAFDELTIDLEKLGYDAYTHEGGQYIGNKSHQVLVLLDPNGQFSENPKQNVTSFAAQKAQTITESTSNLNERLAAFNERNNAYNEKLKNAKTDEDYSKLQKESDSLQQEYTSLTQAVRVQKSQVSKNYGTAENHIDNRTNADVAKTSVKAFQFDYPELHQYYADMAETLIKDAGSSVNIQQRQTGHGSKVQNVRYSNATIDYLMDNLGLSRPKIEKVMQDIITDNGQENYADAKRAELILDDLLTYGYTTMGGEVIPPNAEYIKAKSKINGFSGQNVRQESRDKQSLGSLIDMYMADGMSAEQATAAAKEDITNRQVERKAELPEGMGAASKGQYNTNQFSGNTKFSVNDDLNVDLNNLPAMSNQVNMNPQLKTKGIKTVLDNAYTRIVDTLNPIVKFSKTANDRTAMLASNSKNSGGTVNYIFNDALVDMNGKKLGKSLSDVVKEIPKGKETDFWNYMLQRHNQDRAVLDKNVIGNYNFKMSQQYVKNVEATNPSFKVIGDDIVKWIDEFNRAWGVDSGVVNEEIYNNLRNIYHSYIPTQREFTEVESALTGGSVGQKFVDNNTTLKTATGSFRDINNPVENIMKLVNTTVKTARYNQVGQELVKSLQTNPNGLRQYGEIVSEDVGKSSTGNNVVTVLVDGKPVYVKIYDKELLQSLNGLPKSTAALPGLSQATNTYKSLITQKNPISGAKNFLRDLPTGYAYGSENNPFKYIGKEVAAFKDIAKNTENYQRFKASGGGMSNFFNSGKVEKAASDLTKSNNIFKKTGNVIETFNNAIEEATRLNEFNTVYKKTGDVQKALSASNDVTVNFSRGGDITKTIDKNGVPYLNASVQGIDKFIRNFSTPKSAITSLLKIGISVTAPTIVLAFVNRDNKYYDELSNRIKDAYYCIPNYFGDKDVDGVPTTFIKLPKSRELGVLFGSLFERVARAVGGEKLSSAFSGYGNTVLTNFAPTNPFESNLFSPATYNLATNKDFADRTIVPQSMQDRSKSLQYDEKTSEISKYIANYASKVGVELSPKQLDYLIDSYTGVIGDFLLPATTKGGNALSPLTTAFTSDSTYSNQTLSDFYNNMDRAATKAADKNFSENIDPNISTLEEKISTNYSNASKAISALTKISNRVGVNAMTAEDIKALQDYGINTSLPITDLQRAIKRQEITIAKEAIARGNRANAKELDINNSQTAAKTIQKYMDTTGISQDEAYRVYTTIDALTYPKDATQEEIDTMKANAILAMDNTSTAQQAKYLESVFRAKNDEWGLTDADDPGALIDEFKRTGDISLLKMGTYIDKYANANTVEHYQSVAGLTTAQAHNLMQGLKTLTPEDGKTSVSQTQKMTYILNQSSLNSTQKAKLIGDFYTTQDEDGNTKNQSLLPDIGVNKQLLNYYQKTGDTNAINMLIPATFTDDGEEYTLTDTEKKAYKQAFLTEYNRLISLLAWNALNNEAIAKRLSKAKSSAMDKAKQAVIRSRR